MQIVMLQVGIGYKLQRQMQIQPAPEKGERFLKKRIRIRAGNLRKESLRPETADSCVLAEMNGNFRSGGQSADPRLDPTQTLQQDPGILSQRGK